ncbi:hypothetical protein [Corynebacterium sp. A21]|uniref:hypothetical protein n=1 Tax=Corynebacterium sp. A21 TaxID=3457318 RepID=UPI003FD066BE
MRRSWIRFGLPVLGAVAALGLGVIPGASISAPAQATEAGCPAVVLLVARGNDARETFEPRRYGGEQGWESNGRESTRIGDYLDVVEQRYRDTHGGRSLFTDVQVQGLPEKYYPADIPLPEEGRDGDLLQLLSSAGELTQGAVAGVQRAAAAGTEGPRRAILDYEADTGCTPQYILFGYSLGAVVLPEQEQWLADRGQLAGAVYLGSPFLNATNSRLIGVPAGTTGILSGLPSQGRPSADTPNRIHYCLRDDLVCDPSPQAISRSLQEDEGGPHANYFRELGDTDQIALADALGGWVDQVR